MLLRHLGDPAVLQAIELSLVTSIITVLLTVLLGTPVAYYLSHRHYRFYRLVETLVELPTVLPPAVAGLALLMAFGRCGLIGQAFEAQPVNAGVAVEFSFAGSQQLARQINEGAPADVFASANKEQMDAVIAEGRVDASAAQVFAENRLVVIVPEDNPAGINNLADRAAPGLKLVLAAKEVPVGRYNLEFLRKASAGPQFGATYEAEVLTNVVSYEENVRAVLTKVQLGEAVAGIAYATDAAGGNVGVIEIPLALNVSARYPIAVVSGSPNKDPAKRFVEFVLSQEAQDILSGYGFVQIKQ